MPKKKILKSNFIFKMQIVFNLFNFINLSISLHIYDLHYHQLFSKDLSLLKKKKDYKDRIKGKK